MFTHKAMTDSIVLLPDISKPLFYLSCTVAKQKIGSASVLDKVLWLWWEQTSRIVILPHL